MQHTFNEILEFHLIGKRIITSMDRNETKEMWEIFKPRVGEIENRINENFYSVQIYTADKDIRSFTPQTKFEKWAAVAVSNPNNIPDGMGHLRVPSGKYVVFIHKGPVTTFYKTTNYIFNKWLPNSDFVFDSRPQFEIMDDRYLGPMHPDSEEEVWIPIKEN